MRFRNIFLYALLSILFGIILLSIINLEWKKVEREIGLNQAARKDPLLVANLLLADTNRSAEILGNKTQFLNNEEITIDINNTFVVNEATLFEYPNFKEALTKWISSGGHLVYVISPNRDSLNPAYFPYLGAADIEVVLESNWQNRQNVLHSPIANLSLEYESSILQLYLPYKYYFSGCSGTSHVALDDRHRPKTETDETLEELLQPSEFAESNNTSTNSTAAKIAKELICEIKFDDGFITFVPSIDIISNHGLRHLDHGAFLHWLIGDNEKLYYLPSLKATNWLAALWLWSWQLVTVFIALVISILWYFLVRIGPALTPLSDKKVPFTEHVIALGQFMQANGHEDELKRALIKDIEIAMEFKHVSFKHLSVTEQAKILSKLTGKDLSTIQLILEQPLPNNEPDRIKTIKLFKQLRKAI